MSFSGQGVQIFPWQYIDAPFSEVDCMFTYLHHIFGSTSHFGYFDTSMRLLSILYTFPKKNEAFCRGCCCPVRTVKRCRDPLPKGLNCAIAGLQGLRQGLRGGQGKRSFLLGFRPVRPVRKWGLLK